MQDAYGTPLAAGDKVALIIPHHRRLAKGEVIRTTPRGAYIKWSIQREWPKASEGGEAHRLSEEMIRIAE